MKNWTTALLYGAMCATALLSAMTTLLVVSSSFLPVDDWLVATAARSRALWKAHPIRSHWTRAQRKLWRRLDTLLQGGGGGRARHQLRDMALLHGRDEMDDVDLDFSGEYDNDLDEEDDDCIGVYTDWKHGRICAISR